MSDSDLLDDIVVMLTEVLGDDFLLDLEIDRDTRFTDDLALESIEFVAFAEKVRNKYGEVDFAAFFMGKSIQEIIGLNVGHIVDHIEKSVNERALLG